MSSKLRLVALALSLALATSNQFCAAANAAEKIPVGSVSALIVQFKNGAHAGAAGTLSSVSKFSPSALFEKRALGGGLHLVSFSKPTSLAFASLAANSVLRDPEVSSVTIDRPIGESSVAAKSSPKAPVVLSSTQVKPSVVRNLKFWDAWNESRPQVGAAKLTWNSPRDLAGAKLTGYRLSASTDGGNNFFAFKNTKSRSVFINNLTPGKKYFFRIYAVVKKRGKFYQGIKRQIVVSPTAAPRSPVLNTPQLVFGSTTVSWQLQNPHQSGGLKTTYRVKATNGDETIGCQTVSNSCALQLESLATGYRVSVTATNAKGSATNRISSTPADPIFERQWYLSSANGINAENAWAATEGKSDITVAVIDTGITPHVDLKSSLLTNADGSIYGYDFVGNSATSGDADGWDPDPTDPGDYTASTQSSWHGTEVAGIIGATHNQIGVSGIAPNVKVLPIRALGSDGGSLSDVLAAVNWAAGLHVAGVQDNIHPARVINLSLSSDANLVCDPNSQSVFRHVTSLGAIVVTAAGNRSMDSVNSFPANCASVISVAATNYEGDLASYSNFGNHVTIAAPGGDDRQNFWFDHDYAIFTTSNSGTTIAKADNYSADFGTSLAAPMVSAAIALMLSVNDKLKEGDVSGMLRQSATAFKPATNCFSTGLCGQGILNVAAAIELADLANN